MKPLKRIFGNPVFWVLTLPVVGIVIALLVPLFQAIKNGYETKHREFVIGAAILSMALLFANIGFIVWCTVLACMNIKEGSLKFLGLSFMSQLLPRQRFTERGLIWRNRALGGYFVFILLFVSIVGVLCAL